MRSPYNLDPLPGKDEDLTPPVSDEDKRRTRLLCFFVAPLVWTALAIAASYLYYNAAILPAPHSHVHTRPPVRAPLPNGNSGKTPPPDTRREDIQPYLEGIGGTAAAMTTTATTATEAASLGAFSTPPDLTGPHDQEASPPAPPAPYNGSTRSYTTLTTERPAGYSTTTAGYNRTASYSKESVPSSSSNSTAHTTTEESASGSTYSSVFPVKSRPHSTTAQIDEYYYDEVSSGNETEAFRNDVPNPYDEVLPEIVPYEADITEKSEVLTNEYGNKFVAYTRKAPLQPGLGKKYSVPKRPQTSFDPLNTPSLLPDSTSLYADEDYAEVAPRFSAGNSGRNGRSDEYSASNGKSRGGKRVVPNPAMRRNTSSLFSQTAVLLEYQSTYDQQGSR
ncbi:hypothetical protein V5799_020058 [Amblyomma americanum]|uniref:Uncharacterized protein n=1 Tax=Amblyomma americanum TaxID=6943 RepID=A0AAQ4EV51_AMBAM